MTYGAEIWGPALIGAAGSGLGGLLGGGTPDETKMQKTQRHLVDQLISSINGEGPYSSLYNPSQEAFQKSFVEPAQARFRNQIAPQIQQESIFGGQQRGTGLDDQLLRAGVDMDAMLNQQYYNFNQDALNRKQGSINSILGMGAGPQQQSSGISDILSGVGGYLGGKGFTDTIANGFKNRAQNPPAGQNAVAPSIQPIAQNNYRNGFEKPLYYS